MPAELTAGSLQRCSHAVLPTSGPWLRIRTLTWVGACVAGLEEEALLGQLTRLLSPQQGTDLLQMLTAKGALSKQEISAEVAIPSIFTARVPPPKVRPG